MRLIDADKIGEVSADPYEEGAFQDEIRSQPTVDAITVEFIEKQIAKYNDWNEDVEPLLKLIEDWRKENEESLAE